MSVPKKPPREPSFNESIRTIINSMLDEAHFAMPGFIETYEAGGPNGPMADVSPAFLRTYTGEDGVTEISSKYPVIADVPVAFPRGGGGFLSFPLKKGDPVLLIFCQKSLDAWIDSDGKTQIDPKDARRHHISDAIAYAGLSTKANSIPNAHATDVVMGLEDASFEMHLEPGGNVWVKSPKIILGNQHADNAGNAVARKSDLDSLAQVFNSHIHPGPMGPTSVTPTPQTPTASAKNFAE